jgi:hypothetical protein
VTAVIGASVVAALVALLVVVLLVRPPARRCAQAVAVLRADLGPRVAALRAAVPRRQRSR